MTVLLAGILFIILIVLALYVFGVFATSYLEAFRFAFYLVLLLFVLTLGFALINPEQQGYDPSVRVD